MDTMKSRTDSEDNKEASFEDAEFIQDLESDDPDKHANLPAHTNLFRHPLMKGKSSPYAEKMAKTLELDEKLELKPQAIRTQKKMIKKDIDDLTGSNNYFEVTKKGLEKLFRINNLRQKCSWWNLGKLTKAIYTNFQFIFATAAISAVAWVSATIVGSLFANAIAIASTVACIVGIIKLLNDGAKFSFHKIMVDLKIDDVEVYKGDMPDGAKYKLLEAKESKIFKKFVVAYPHVSFATQTVEIPRVRFETDPAILGESLDGRLYMVCYWDIKNDVDRAIDQIEKFKHLKIEE